MRAIKILVEFNCGADGEDALVVEVPFFNSPEPKTLPWPEKEPDPACFNDKLWIFFSISDTFAPTTSSTFEDLAKKWKVGMAVTENFAASP